MRWFAAIALLSISCAAIAAQTATPNSSQAPISSATPAPMTKQQAKELFHSVDEILSFVSSDTKLPIEHSVKRKLISRDAVNHYLIDFENIRRDAEQRDPSGRAVHTHLLSDMGRVYLFLAHVSGRIA